jgi:hypothetical protein
MHFCQISDISPVHIDISECKTIFYNILLLQHKQEYSVLPLHDYVNMCPLHKHSCMKYFMKFGMDMTLGDVEEPNFHLLFYITPPTGYWHCLPVTLFTI